MPPRKRRTTAQQKKQSKDEEENAASSSSGAEMKVQVKEEVPTTRTAAGKRTRSSRNQQEKQEQPSLEEKEEQNEGHTDGAEEEETKTKGAKRAKKTPVVEDVKQEEECDQTTTQEEVQQQTYEPANFDELPDKPTEILEAQQKVSNDPYDMGSWQILIDFAKKQPAEVAQEVFDELLEVFPKAAEYCRMYAEKQHAAGNWEEVDRILSSHLLHIPDPKLWKFYLDYVHDVKLRPALEKLKQEREKNVQDGEAKQEVHAARFEVANAYEYALGRLGRCHGTDDIWWQFIRFLKEEEAESMYEESQKRDALRRAYRRALTVPLNSIDTLWQEYNTFERGLEQSVDEQDKRNYERSKKVSQQRLQKWGNIQFYLLPRPLREGDNAAIRQQFSRQVALWRHLLAYEASNPLELSEEDHRELMRVQFEQALLSMQFLPDIWEDWASFEINRDNTDEADEIYDRALENIPDCATLAFVVADFHELSDNRSKAQNIYEKLLEVSPSPMAYIQYQRFMRRYDGIKGARKVFRRARKSPHICPSIFLAAAQLEFHANRLPNVAVNILELGRKKFPEDVDYAAAYLNFISPISEDNNMRALFENILSSVPGEQARPIWDMYLDYEIRRAQGGGSLEKVAKIEARRAHKYPEDENQVPSPFLRLLHRYQHWGMLPDSVPDKDMLYRYRVKPRLFHTASGGYFNAEEPIPETLQGYLPDSFGIQNQRRKTTVAEDHQQKEGQTSLKRPIPPNTPEFLHKLVSLIPFVENEQSPSEAEVNYRIQTFQDCELPESPEQNGETRNGSSGSDLYRQRQRQQMEATGALELP